MFEFDNAITYKHQIISQLQYINNFLEKDKAGFTSSNKDCMISVYRADQMKRFTPFSYLNHAVIESKY